MFKFTEEFNFIQISKIVIALVVAVMVLEDLNKIINMLKLIVDK